MARRQAQFWVFVSGKGGVGKSVLLYHVGAALARAKKRVLLLDADLGLANLHILANVEPRGRLERVLAGAEVLGDAVTPLETGCDLLASENGQHLSLLPGNEAAAALADTLGTLTTGYDYILVDTPRGLNEAGLQFCRACDLTVLVTSDEPTAITNTYAWYKLATLAHPALPVAIVANGTTDASIESRFSALCRRFLGHAPAWGGTVPPDQEVARAVARQEPVFSRAPEGPYWQAVPQLATRLQVITKQSDKTDETVPSSRTGEPGQPC